MVNYCVKLNMENYKDKKIIKLKMFNGKIIMFSFKRIV